MELKKSERSNAKIKMALQAPSRAGKSYSALLLAHWISRDKGRHDSLVITIPLQSGSSSNLVKI